MSIIYLLRRPGIPHQLIHEALAGRHDSAFMPQPRQRNRHFLLVAAALPFRNDIYLVSGLEEIERRLRNADVAFDADDDAGERAGGVERVERLLDF